MKRTIKLLLSISLILIMTGNSFSLGVRQIKKVPAVEVEPCTLYTWYWDEEYTNPVGGSGRTIAAECSRLNSMFPGYVFQSSPGMGLMPFEYGKAYPIPPVVIYSNIW